MPANMVLWYMFKFMRARPTTSMNPNPNQLLLYKLYFTMSISNWLVFMFVV